MTADHHLGLNPGHAHARSAEEGAAAMTATTTWG